MKILIKGGNIITMNSKREEFVGDILIIDNKIAKVAKNVTDAVDKTIDASGKVVIPGLIQTHTHLTQALFRGQADDLALLDWLEKKIWPFEAAHTAESNHVSAQLGIAELIKGGTTAIVDMATVRHTESIMQAIAETGYRAIVGKCMMDLPGTYPGLKEDTKASVDESIELLKKWHNTHDGRIKYAFNPRFVVSCTEELLKEVVKYAKQYDVHIHTHASENIDEIAIVQKQHGMRNINYLDHIGVTGPNTILAHCIWLDEQEKQIIMRTYTKVTHCPSSNMKLASGICQVPELKKMGITVGLGADGAPCNNNLNMFVEMRRAALLQKVRTLDPTALPAHEVFEMATLGGAKVMGQEKELGSLEVGKLADIAIIDLHKPHSSPTETVDTISSLVYSTHSEDVTHTIINGKILMEDRQLLTINEKKVLADANLLIKEIIRKVQESN